MAEVTLELICSLVSILLYSHSLLGNSKAKQRALPARSPAASAALRLPLDLSWFGSSPHKALCSNVSSPEYSLLTILSKICLQSLHPVTLLHFLNLYHLLDYVFSTRICAPREERVGLFCIPFINSWNGFWYIIHMQKTRLQTKKWNLDSFCSSHPVGCQCL